VADCGLTDLDGANGKRPRARVAGLKRGRRLRQLSVAACTGRVRQPHQRRVSAVHARDSRGTTSLPPPSPLVTACASCLRCDSLLAARTQVLDLSQTGVDSPVSVEFLANIPHLRALSLEGTPLSGTPSRSVPQWCSAVDQGVRFQNASTTAPSSDHVCSACACWTTWSYGRRIACGGYAALATHSSLQLAV
jgi:hypothetical protein